MADSVFIDASVPSRTNHNARSAEFLEGIRREFAHDVLNQRDHQRFQFPVADISSRDEQSLRWMAGKDMGVDEVDILGNHDPPFPVGQSNDLGIACPIRIGQVEGV